ncbi:MAG: hypothetical protein ACXVFQ_02405 [Solirubrobacteraceae bacterium]
MSDRRARLAAREAELVRALQGGPTPDGLDEKMIRLTRDALARKRARQVARAFPALVRDLGREYQSMFDAFTLANPPREEGGLADGLAFGASVAGERRLSDEARVELLIARSTMKRRRGRLEARRGPYLAATLMRDPPGITVVGRLARQATRVLTLSAPGRGGTRA